MHPVTENIRKAMKANNITQVNLSEKVGVSQAELSRRLKNVKLDEDFLKKLMEALKMSKEDLFRPNPAKLKMGKSELEEALLGVKKGAAKQDSDLLLVEIRNRLEGIESILHRILAKLDR